MKLLFVLNGGPADAGRSDSALRLASALLRAEDVVVRVFLLNDAVCWAAAAGSVRAARDGPAHEVSALINAGGVIAVSETGLRDRNISPNDLVIGAEPAGLSTLAAWCLESDRLMVF